MTRLLANVSDHTQFVFLLHLSFDRSHAAPFAPRLDPQ
jgi:hypothetical protein